MIVPGPVDGTHRPPIRLDVLPLGPLFRPFHVIEYLGPSPPIGTLQLIS
jgi:hypothetical protein